ncbi:MAG: hypothetical protein FJX65_05210 [Alphaproteobacteria bacterium]|nr:hypothetical protein [Alphaproteobacteria bacterium]
MTHKGKLLAAALLAMGIWTLDGSAQAAEIRPEHPAVKARLLQTELMVAALYCDERGRYNAFVRKFRNELTAYGKQLQKLFRDAHGAQAQPNLDQFITRVANAESQRHLADTNAHCEDSSILFTELLNLNRSEFRRFSDQRGIRLPTASLALR